MLDVAGAAEVRGEEFLLVGHAVVVRVGELPDLVGVRLHRQHAVGAEGQHEAREDELVDEDGVTFVDAVVVRVFVARDAADRVELAGGIGILHVTAQLEDEHPAVAVERDGAWLFDVGFGQDGRDAVAGLEDELFLLLRSGERKDRRLLAEIGFGIGGVGGARPALSAAAATPLGAAPLFLARLTGLPHGRLCLLRGLRLDDEREAAKVPDATEGECRPRLSLGSTPIPVHSAFLVAIPYAQARRGSRCGRVSVV